MRGMFRKAIVILLAAVLLAGCRAADSNMSKNEKSVVNIDDGINQSPSNGEDLDTDTYKEASETSSSSNTDTRKIIFTYTYRIETKDLDQSVLAIENAVNKAGGYYEESNIDGNSKEGGYADYILRIPTDKLDSFVEGINTFGNVVNQSKNGQDVTSQYYDIESRLTSLKIQQERILELLKQANSLDDIIKLESELTKVRTNIEQLTTKLKKYDGLIDYATVNITINQVLDYTDNNENFGTTVIETFGDSFEFALEMVKVVIIVLIWLLPYIIVIGLIVAAAVVIDRKTKKKRAERYNNMRARAQAQASSVPPAQSAPSEPPAGSTAPIQPTQSVSPIQPERSATPGQPTGPVAPVQPAQSASSIPPTVPTKPEDNK